MTPNQKHALKLLNEAFEEVCGMSMSKREFLEMLEEHLSNVQSQYNCTEDELSRE